jgi:hypothetical protein
VLRAGVGQHPFSRLTLLRLTLDVGNIDTPRLVKTALVVVVLL